MNAQYKNILLFFLFLPYAILSKIIVPFKGTALTHPLTSLEKNNETFAHAIKKINPRIIDYTITGYIKAESYTDTRQTTAEPEEGLIDLYPYFPVDRQLDPAGNDINAVGQTQLDAFDSRIKCQISGIKINNATAQAIFETNLFAISLMIPNIFFLRHAYMQLDWDHATSILGFTTHPIAFPTPNTINYNGIFPFDFYARAAQWTLIYHTKAHIDIIGSAASQVTFQSVMPTGLSQEFDVLAAERGIVPNLHFQLRFKKNSYTAGAAIDYTRLKPQIETNAGYSTDTALSSLAGIAYFLIDRPRFYIHNKLVVGQDPIQYGAMGGYAVVKNSTNPITGTRKYTNLSVIGLWTDINFTTHRNVSPGIFMGFQKALGAAKKIDPNITNDQGITIDRRIFGFATDVKIAFRASPRLVISIGKINFGIELEYTRADYGTITDQGRVIHTHPVTNIRTLFASYYYF